VERTAHVAADSAARSELRTARGSTGYPRSGGGTLACGSAGAGSALVSALASPHLHAYIAYPCSIVNHRRGACTVATIAAVDRARWEPLIHHAQNNTMFSCMIFQALLKRILILSWMIGIANNKYGSNLLLLSSVVFFRRPWPCLTNVDSHLTPSSS
jgi:hypothetical protein